VIRIVVPLEIQPGRSVRPIKPLLSWELKPGLEITLPPEIESILICEGLAEPVQSSEVK
jgi:hypothetical protein